MILGMAVAAFALSLVAIVIGIIALIELRSFNKSTHQVQWVPTADNTLYDENGFEILSDDTKEKLQDSELSI
jgi:Na+-transporting methylmalonyl-CoA/oxaloacetate decarboxylase gamma subunit